MSFDVFCDGVSVIVCCFNSENRIATTLAHLARQKFSKPVNWEVILVDNNCRDGTVALSRKTWDESGQHAELVIVREDEAGLGHARKRGIENARFNLVLFCDDDNWLDDNYIEDLIRVFSDNPSVGVCGGVGVAVADGELPTWFDEFKRSYATGPQAQSTGVADRYIYGAGMGMRRSILTNRFIQSFTPVLKDRSGNLLSSGGDGELNEWAILQGYQLWYEESLRFTHYVPMERLSFAYLSRLQFGFGAATPFLRIYRFQNWRSAWPFQLANNLFCFVRLACSRTSSIRRKLGYTRLLGELNVLLFQIPTLIGCRRRINKLRRDLAIKKKT
jgi:glycosyltransferase involved in cell wall biosynthesis